MLGHELRHLKHADRLLAAEHDFEFVVGIDVSPVHLVLKAVLLDVGPQFLGDLGAGHCLVADDRCEGRVGIHGLHERRIGFPFAFCHL